MKEIVRDYDIDAIFANRWQGHGVCYCDACTDRFREATGHELPHGRRRRRPGLAGLDAVAPRRADAD